MTDPLGLGQQGQSAWPSKHDRFDSRFARDVLEACGRSDVARLLRQDDRLTCQSANEYLDKGLHIGTAKVSRDVTLAEMISPRKFAKSQVYTRWLDERSNWGDPPVFALAFDRHGDGVPPLVLVDSPRYIRSPWYAAVEVPVGCPSGALLMTTYTGFLGVLVDDSGLKGR